MSNAPGDNHLRQRADRIDSIRVMKVDPTNMTFATIVLPAKMEEVAKRLHPAKRFGRENVARVGAVTLQMVVGLGQPADMACFAIKGHVFRGPAILYGNAGAGPADVPINRAWMVANLNWRVDPDAVVHNDPLPEPSKNADQQ